jgi:hypothetical protein
MNFFDKLKKSTPAAQVLIDPLDIIGKTKGRKNTQPGNADKDKGMADYQQAIKDFEMNGNNQFDWLGDYAGPGDVGNTEYDGITIDPRYSQFEMQALRDLEQQSKDGLSARDQADLAQLEGQVNRQNAGRQGAIQQNMAARGMGGSGMELVAQMAASQDATERQALASMEKAAMAQDGRRAATAQLGAQAGQMSARDWQQQAQRAQAQDAINKFNNSNSMQVGMYNHGGRQGTANNNTNQNNQFAQQKLGARQGGAQMTYNKGAEANNTVVAKDQAKNAMIGQVLGVGAEVGKMYAGGMFEGGVVPGKAKVPGDHPANDTVPTMLSPGEVVLPRSAVQGDGIEALLKAMDSMKRGKQ